MTLKRYLVSMAICAGLCWIGWLLVLFLVDPERAGFLGHLAFYLSLFLALTGTLALAGFIIRARISTRAIFREVEVSFRQAIWIAAFIVFLFLFRSFQLLRWWNLGLFTAFLIVLEAFFLTYKKRG
jgi:hypothetical protein